MSGTRRTSVLFGAFLAFVVSATTTTCELYALSPRGSAEWLWVPLAAIFPIMLALLLLPLALVLLVPQPTRRFADRLASFCLAYLIIGVVGIMATDRARMWAFGALARRSEPLVAAIHHFENDNHRPPSSLEELTPRYLRTVPGTGMGAHPDYRYDAGPGNDWTLIVLASEGPFSWDRFVYDPHLLYRNARRIGKWVYVRE